MAYTPGLGTLLQLSISSTYTTVAQVVSIQPPQMERGEIDTTHLSSTWKEKLAAIPDAGDVEFTVEWDPAATTHAQLWTNFQAGAADAWKIVFQDAGDAEVTFSGFIKSFPWDQVEVEGVVTISFTVAITGAVTITP